MCVHYIHRYIVVSYLKTSFFHPTAGFEVGTDALAGALLEFWELAGARLNDGLDLLLWLFGDGHHAVQVLIDEQAHKHLRGKRRGERGEGGGRCHG